MSLLASAFILGETRNGALWLVLLLGTVRCICRLSVRSLIQCFNVDGILTRWKRLIFIIKSRAYKNSYMYAPANERANARRYLG